VIIENMLQVYSLLHYMVDQQYDYLSMGDPALEHSRTVVAILTIRHSRFLKHLSIPTQSGIHTHDEYCKHPDFG
jgi:hypothetical protein